MGGEKRENEHEKAGIEVFVVKLEIVAKPANIRLLCVQSSYNLFGGIS